MKEFLNTKIDKIRINGTGFFLCAMSYIYISIIIFFLSLAITYILRKLNIKGKGII